jgi:hypothetical protein
MSNKTYKVVGTGKVLLGGVFHNPGAILNNLDELVEQRLLANGQIELVSDNAGTAEPDGFPDRGASTSQEDQTGQQSAGNTAATAQPPTPTSTAGPSADEVANLNVAEGTAPQATNLQANTLKQ